MNRAWRRFSTERLQGDAGQASTELVALLPLIAVAAALVWQVALAGHATWAAGAGARAAARAAAIGADAERAARTRLPGELREGLRVRRRADGSVHVAVRIPPLLPAIRLPRASATAQHPGQQ